MARATKSDEQAVSKRFHQLLTKHRRKPTAATWFSLGTQLASAPPALAEKLGADVGDPVECWRRCVRLDPKHDDAWLCLGEAYFERDDRANAIKAFTRATKLDPKNALAWYRLGILSFPAVAEASMARLDKAERFLSRAIEVDRRGKKLGWEPYAWLAEIAERRRDDPGALAWYAESTRRGDRYAAARKQVIEGHGARRRPKRRRRS
jgi:tetratricopeptide (TPR) repeat protein